jgi:DNA (cytosine-5)-methyltransferase 1
VAVEKKSSTRRKGSAQGTKPILIQTKKEVSSQLTVIDFFCGAGGFSEGFRQMGFNILYGYDNWENAVDTFNFNFDLECKPKNILDFKISTEAIEEIPNTDVIIGSPPCVSFSSSNKSGKADKSLGVELTECFLRIIAVKKHQKNSILKAWFMENVVNSKRYLQPSYTFKDLGLSDWATKNRLSPKKIAIDLLNNSEVINSADYGAFQARKRVISGEIISKKKLIVPKHTHQNKESNGPLPFYKSISLIKDSFPNPFSEKSNSKIKDVQYDISIEQSEITDHFYDTGIYETEWKISKFWKTNHPYMGKLSFPENENNPSRTITATRIANSRESIIYRSENNRNGDGEYRLATIREAAIIMGFPISHQFLGTESKKWRLVGNAVCCSVSRAFASTVLNNQNKTTPRKLKVHVKSNIETVKNLNTYKLKVFDSPPVKSKGARFRRHPIKDGNLTVTLSNYDIQKNSRAKSKWMTSIQYGTGEGFPIQNVPDYFYVHLEKILKESTKGLEFIKIINNGFTEKIAASKQLQTMYEIQKPIDGFLTPSDLVDEIQKIIERLKIKAESFEQTSIKIFKKKEIIPMTQLYALYAVNKISTVANTK